HGHPTGPSRDEAFPRELPRVLADLLHDAGAGDLGPPVVHRLPLHVLAALPAHLRRAAAPASERNARRRAVGVRADRSARARAGLPSPVLAGPPEPLRRLGELR